MKKKKIPLLYVEWNDATGNSEWAKIEDIKKEKLALVREVGWLVHEDKEIIKLTSQFCDEEDGGNRTTLDKKWIKKRKVLKVKL